MIRVLQIGLTSNIGGTETFIMNLYRNIDREKIQFDFLVEHTKKLVFEDEIINMGGRVYYEYYLLREKNNKDYISPEEFLSRHPDINAIHINAQEPNTLVRFLIAAKKRGIECRVFHSHNAGYIQGQNLKQKIYEVYARYIINRYTTEKLACSENAAQFMFKTTRDIKIIPNSIDLEKFKFNSDIRLQLRERLEYSKKDKVIGFVGSFNYQKNILFILEIFKEVIKNDDSYKLLMLGEGEYKQQFLEKSKEYKISDRIICLGNKKNVNEYMNVMDVFLFPSRWEGFGIVLLEAQALGLRCFTSKSVVPMSTNVTGNVEFISLEESAKVWAGRIIDSNLKRYDGVEIIKKSEYTISNLVNQINTVYMKYRKKG